MDIDIGYVLVSLLLGCFGAAYFVYGKRQSHVAALICGIALLGIPYFVSDLSYLLLVGIALIAIPWILRRFS